MDEYLLNGIKPGNARVRLLFKTDWRTLLHAFNNVFTKLFIRQTYDVFHIIENERDHLLELFVFTIHVKLLVLQRFQSRDFECLNPFTSGHV